MPELEAPQEDERLRQLAHDLQHCLYVIGLGTELLKAAREDESRFAELYESIDQERKAANELVGELVAVVLASREGTADGDKP